MDFPPNRLAILTTVGKYRVVRAKQIQQRVLPRDTDCSITRGHLRKLVRARWLRKYQPRLTDSFLTGSAPPVYTITCEGSSGLAVLTNDPSHLIKAEVSFSNYMAANHWAAVSHLAMTIDDSLARAEHARLMAMHFEYDVLDPKEKEPSKRFFLYEKMSDKICFVPDMAFEIEMKGRNRRAYYVEYETGSDTPARVAAKKHKGVAAFATTDLFKKHFPEATDWRLIVFCPNPGWRDILRNEMKRLPSKNWMFCATSEITADNLLHDPMLYEVDSGPHPLLPRPT